MKKFRKIMDSIVVVATLGSIATTPVNVIVTIPSSPNDSRVSYY